MPPEGLTRAQALERLEAFLPRAGSAYARDRNIDPGPNDTGHVSKLSPYVRHRLIGEWELARAAEKAHGAAASKFIDEVCWRSYWRGYLEMRPALWASYVDYLLSDEAETARQTDTYCAAVSGQTGIDAFDVWTAELITTGYLHNHARMSFASIWVHTLRLPWQLGAAFFLEHLLDGDEAANTLSWRWVAGLHTPGKVYLASSEAIDTCSAGRFRPTGLAHTAAPVPMEPPVSLSPLAGPLATPREPSVLLITAEDLGADGFRLGDIRLAGIAAYVSGKAPVGAAIAATAQTLAEQTDTEVRLFDTPDELAAAVAAFGAGSLVTSRLPIGTTRTDLLHLLGRMDVPVRLHERTRLWDAIAWAAASRGFYAFRPVIAHLMALTDPGGFQDRL
ncbi:FAD-binding domain-containing protein [Asticcacaulis excentricus]|uniref:DNA photolyase FAD-binding protein n=1 Tax=Asticcacaulis excentricus (strain ATCC 15261 / DSM 4724 / KCTC 12464 / NCIMB 9791 / VKM B-1370 / CB 48) TaxID=573065 RepID=E8RVI9_ASTEC|nr:FAD-binding domain-containing protein [Asticcacaulis excentricus]ADU15158.1 DNA photolyase FAD-binding protein [Asticcacaulis excentricus CB 48]